MHSETDASLASSWNCLHWATGLGGRQTARSRPSDRRQRTPDGRACCDDVVVRRDGGGWKIEVADDWHHPMWGGSSSLGIASKTQRWRRKQLFSSLSILFTLLSWTFEVLITRFNARCQTVLPLLQCACVSDDVVWRCPLSRVVNISK